VFESGKLATDMALLERTFPGTIEGTQIRIDAFAKPA